MLGLIELPAPNELALVAVVRTLKRGEERIPEAFLNQRTVVSRQPFGGYKPFVNPFIDKRDIWVSRVDVATDYMASLEDFHLIPRYARSCTAYYSSGAITGLLVGSRRSQVAVKYYDKRVQLRHVHRVKKMPRHPVTRVEAENKYLKLRLKDLKRLKNPFEGHAFFNVEAISLDSPYREIIDVARFMGLGIFSTQCAPEVRRELRKRLEETERVGKSHHAPRRAFDYLWTEVAGKFLRDIGMAR